MNFSYEIITAESFPPVCWLKCLGVRLEFSQFFTQINTLDVHNNIQKCDSRASIVNSLDLSVKTKSQSG